MYQWPQQKVGVLQGAYSKKESIYLNDSFLPAGIIILGNNYEKVSLLCKALGLNIVGRNILMRFQKHCAAPVVEEVLMEIGEMTPQLTVPATAFTPPWSNSPTL